MLMNFHLFVAGDHGPCGFKRRYARGGHIHMTDDESGKRPCDKGMERGKDWKSAKPVGCGWEFLHAPHQCTGQDLQRQQDVQNAKVGSLLDWVHAAVGSFLKRVRLVLED